MSYSNFFCRGRRAVLSGLAGFAFLCGAVFLAPVAKATGWIESTNRFVWSETSGWIDFAPGNQSVSLQHNGTNRFLTGFVWGENIGYIRLSSSASGPFLNTTATNWGVNLSKAGLLTGFAWGENVGWINFGGSNSVVQLNAATGFLQGYAWGENIGWIRFNSDTNSTIAYGLKVDSGVPKVAIASPKSNQRFTNLFSILMTGTASDPGNGLARVEYRINGGSFSNAVGTTNWNAVLTLVPGTNRVEVKSVDLGGNESSLLSRTFFCVTFAELTLNHVGSGTIVSTPGALGTPTNGAMLEVGRSYTVTAVPATNHLFRNWTGTTTSSDAKYVFTMQPGLELTANFVTNSFIAAAGTYNGLFSEENVNFHSAGFATIRMNSKLGFSGKVLVDGDTVSFSGKMSVDGIGSTTSKGRMAKRDKPELLVQLNVDLLNGTDSLTGMITQPGPGGWTSALTAHRNVWRTNIADQATAFTNRYSMLLTNNTLGTSYGLMSVDKLGKMKLAGHVVDGHIIKQSTAISKLGYWPLFTPLYKQPRTNNQGKTIIETKGFVLGWLQLTNIGFGHPAPTGAVHWIKTTWTNSTYTAGLTNSMEAIGSRWLPPTPRSGIRAIDTTELLLNFSAGDLNDPFSARYSVTTNTTLSVIAEASYPNVIRASLAPRTGLIKGQFLHPGNGNSPVKWFGAILQDQNCGGGLFMGPTNSGTMTATAVE